MNNDKGLYFLIDYENVGKGGLEGVEFLKKEDSLAIFCSAVKLDMERKYMDCILESECYFEAVRLQVARKNALDFYVASKVGELIGLGNTSRIIIVSNDKGYNSVIEYWRLRGVDKDRILLEPSVQDGIVAAERKSERRNTILSENALVSIEKEYGEYQERERIKSRLEDLFKNTEYEKDLKEIYQLVITRETPKELYLGSVKEFGRENGREIYRRLKQPEDDPTEA